MTRRSPAGGDGAARLESTWAIWGSRLVFADESGQNLPNGFIAETGPMIPDPA
ncbi:hypothetical protein [Streptosporangium amethystogenes]|uniref:hypothetical protein n=1 Tax=Streptosporangium amethystogenes TaxID=2002 RepID=UPI0014707489|nr:hypothetical protein [Streptosporangium amethystogenes]